MGRKLVITDGARRDLRNIRRYTLERWGKAQWAAYGKTIEGRLDKVFRKPDLGRKRPNLPSGVFLYRAGHHFLVYRFDNEEVRFLRILHERMDFGRHVQ